MFTLHNSCPYIIWAGIQSSAGHDMIGNGGFQLNPGQSTEIQAPTNWSGRFWPRRDCSFDQTGRGTCQTGDCGGVLNCVGAGGSPPVTLAEFTLNSPVDYYDVSLVDGYNVPMSIVPVGYRPRSSSCQTVRCESDLNWICPSDLQVLNHAGEVVACKSACMAFNTPEFCCTGEYASPEKCRPTAYSKVFKNACPASYSYAYDDPTSIFMCRGANYLITFCWWWICSQCSESFIWWTIKQMMYY